MVYIPPLIADPVTQEKPFGHFADKFYYPLPLHKFIALQVYTGVFYAFDNCYEITLQI
jgi:hypothetical protein